MPEVRVDPLTGHRTIIAAARSARPGAGLAVQPPAPIDPARDPFAEGHEDQTPPEVYAVRPNGGGPDAPGWTVRVAYAAKRSRSRATPAGTKSNA